MSCPILSQLEEQSDQLEKLKRELEAKAAELVRVQEALSRTEQVWWPLRIGSCGWFGGDLSGLGCRSGSALEMGPGPCRLVSSQSNGALGIV